MRVVRVKGVESSVGVPNVRQSRGVEIVNQDVIPNSDLTGAAWVFQPYFENGVISG